MKVIYHDFEVSHHALVIAKLYRKYQWNPVCIAGAHVDKDGTIDGVSLDNCIISNPYKLRRSEFNYDEITPPLPVDASILEALSRYEATYIDILGVFQDNTGWEFSYTERKNFYIDILTYWNTVINACEPDLIVFYDWPHTPSCYSLYLISKHYYNIDVLFIDPNPLLDQDYHIISNSVESLSNSLNIGSKDTRIIDPNNKNDSLLTVDDIANNNSEPKHIVADFNKYENSGPLLNRIYKYSKEKIKFSNIPRLYTHFKGVNIDRKANTLPYYLSKSRMNLVQLLIFFEKLKFNNRKLKKYYHTKTVSPNLNTPFIYFSAPYQPEATSYLGGRHYESIMLTLSVLSYACPKDWVIYYKEHPATFFDKFRGSLKRDNWLYNKINGFQNIKMVASDYDQFALIENSKAVALISGSTAWQAVVRGKPVISFGQGWYSGCKGIMQVSSLQDVKDVLKLIISGYTPDSKDVDQYVSIIKQVAFKFPERYSQKVYDKPRAEEVADEFYKAYIKFNYIVDKK